MTWKELKKLCNSIPESKLENKVILWRESNVVTRIEAKLLSEDHYIDPEVDGEGCYPESEASSPIKDLKKVYDKGDPILWENF